MGSAAATAMVMADAFRGELSPNIGRSASPPSRTPPIVPAVLYPYTNAADRAARASSLSDTAIIAEGRLRPKRKVGTAITAKVRPYLSTWKSHIFPSFGCSIHLHCQNQNGSR